MPDWSEFASPSVALLLVRSAAPQVKAITNGRCANVPSPLWLDDKLGGLRPRMPGGATISNFCRPVFELRNCCWWLRGLDRKSTRLNSSHSQISYAVFCLKKKNT